MHTCCTYVCVRTFVSVSLLRVPSISTVCAMITCRVQVYGNINMYAYKHTHVCVCLCIYVFV